MCVELENLDVFGALGPLLHGGPSGYPPSKGALFPCVCRIGVVLQVQWTQKNDKKRPFLFRLSFRDGLQDLRSKCHGRHLREQKLDLGEPGQGIGEGNPKARQTEQLCHTHLFGGLSGPGDLRDTGLPLRWGWM